MGEGRRSRWRLEAVIVLGAVAGVGVGGTEEPSPRSPGEARLKEAV